MSFSRNCCRSTPSDVITSKSKRGRRYNEKEAEDDLIFDLGSPSSNVSSRSAASNKKASGAPNRILMSSDSNSDQLSDLKDTTSNQIESGVTFDLGAQSFVASSNSSTTTGSISTKEHNRYSNNLSLTYKQMEECEEVFIAFETENGTVDAEYLPTMVPALLANGDPNTKPTERELRHLARAIQANDQQLDFSLFLHVVAPYIRRANVNFSKQKIDAAFKMFDVDGNGYITASELRKVLRNCFGDKMRDVANNLDDDDIEEIMVEADLDGDGRISYSEFAAIIPHLSDGVYIGIASHV
jgi:calmodulin